MTFEANGVNSCLELLKGGMVGSSWIPLHARPVGLHICFAAAMTEYKERQHTVGSDLKLYHFPIFESVIGSYPNKWTEWTKE